MIATGGEMGAWATMVDQAPNRSMERKSAKNAQISARVDSLSDSGSVKNDGAHLADIIDTGSIDTRIIDIRIIDTGARLCLRIDPSATAPGRQGKRR